jgi:hypothetical protein
MKKRHTINTDDFDEHGLLRDGHRYRVPMTLRDSKPKPTQHLHDGHGNQIGHRPGWVVATNPLNVAQRQQAHDAYLDELTNAWRGDAVGEGPEGSVCTVKGAAYPALFGSPGHIKNGVCVPDQLAADARAKPDPEEDPDDDDEDDKDEDDDDNEVRDTRRRRRFRQYDPQGRQRSVTEEDTAKRMRDHQANMQRLYNDRDYELTQAWRNPR